MSKYISMINGKWSKSISVLDRGLSYGDGLFETMSWCLLENKKVLGVEFWDRHLRRLRASCSVTKIKFPSNDLLTKYKNKILKRSYASGMREGVLKIIITRGVGGRGYKFEKDITPTVIFLTFPNNQIDTKFYKSGVKLRFCNSSIFSNPQLAGLKHLNRMDSVLARSEWDGKNFFDGVMVDDSNNIIDGTMTNIFFSKNNILYTPLIKKSGLNGVMRQVVIEKSKLFFKRVIETQIKKNLFKTFDEMFITNSIIKILPVKNLQEKNYKISNSTRQLIDLFSDPKTNVKHFELI